MTHALGRIALSASSVLLTCVTLSGAGAGVAQTNRSAPQAHLTGDLVFHTRCAICHDARGMGTVMLSKRLGRDKGELAKRTDLEAGYVTAVVRNGLMSMPAFTRVDLSDAELAQVNDYLTRNNAPAGKP
ncbi:MAG: cytochrome c [Sphingomonadales bacterium]|nr:cytochrome c [Sphingomonadales bacterium]MDE2170862.1 cytochrome c [Sphingomonadales bacterium]